MFCRPFSPCHRFQQPRWLGVRSYSLSLAPNPNSRQLPPTPSPAFPLLAHLYLGCNSIGDEGAGRLAAALGQCASATCTWLYGRSSFARDHSVQLRGLCVSSAAARKIAPAPTRSSSRRLRLNCCVAVSQSVSLTGSLCLCPLSDASLSFSLPTHLAYSSLSRYTCILASWTTTYTRAR